jgi:1,4-alpha-glucan branching enzyme
MALETDIDLICAARHPDAFSVLGPHRQADGKVSVRTFLPQALSVQLINPVTDEPIGLMKRHGSTDFFSGILATEKEYRIAVLWRDTSTSQIDDPYRFPPILIADECWLLASSPVSNFGRAS